jgi:hypothetical protein
MSHGVGNLGRKQIRRVQREWRNADMEARWRPRGMYELLEERGMSDVTIASLKSPLFIVVLGGKRRTETLNEPLPDFF